METPRILAVVITYNPDIEVLYRNIHALSKQIDCIVLYDNSSNNVCEVCELVKSFENVDIVINECNDGLPKNYNRGLKRCICEGYEWLLTMDQDTIVPNDLIQKYSIAFEFDDVAIISPVVLDRNVQTEEEVLSSIGMDKPWTEINECISSASLNRVSILKKLGGFDEKLFIDQVDFDYCRSVVLDGHKIIRINNCLVDHQIGNGQILKLLGKKVIISNHSPIRKYYIFRNKTYIARKYHITLFNNPSYYTTMLKQFLILFFEKDRGKKVINALRGMWNGLKM